MKRRERVSIGGGGIMLLFRSLRMLITLACPNNWCAHAHAWQRSRNVLKSPARGLIGGQELRVRVMKAELKRGSVALM